jgi:hypothetical protein
MRFDTNEERQAWVKKTLVEINGDRALASAMLFSHRHPQATPRFHVEIMDMWRASDEFVVIEAFREAAKTTLSEEFLLTEACFGNFRYALIFGETYTKAVQRIAAIKYEAAKNPKIRRLFGDVKGEPWAENRICIVSPLGYQVMIEAHGWEEEVRGYKWLDARPDRAYLDDVENKSMVRDTAAVDASWRKLNTEIVPAMDKSNRKIRVTGTPLADDCLVNRCNRSPEWVSGKFPIVVAPGCEGVEALDAVNADGTSAAVSMWPERYPLEWVRGERDRFERAGLLREFVQEYFLIAAQTQGKPFTEDLIRVEEVAPLYFAPKVYVVDPARTSNLKKSDRTGRVVISRIGTRIYVHESSGEYWKPSEIIESCFETSGRFDDCEVAIERNSLDDFLMEPLRAEMMRRGMSLDLTPILAPADRSKEEFILGLQAWFKAGDIVFVGGKGKHAQLVQEILNFPSGKRDILNALAYAQRVFGGQAVYGEFSQENIVRLAEPGQNDQLVLGIHQTPRELVSVLVSVSGRRMTVLADFVTAHAAGDAVKDIYTLVRSMYPNRRVATWVAADVYDQQGRNALLEALRLSKVAAYRGGYVTQARGCMSDLIRTQIDGRRMLLVDSSAKATLKALAGGYRYSIGRDGRPSGDPDDNVSRSVGVCLEILTSAIESGKTGVELPDGFGDVRNSSGAPYLSALGKPRRNH